MDNNSLYRPSGNVKDTNRTYVPDLYRQVAAEMMEEDGPRAGDTVNERTVLLQNRPIIGVMYSISAGINGELFPVYVGRNVIGSDLSCDICLRESSVSAQHGILLARKQTDEQGREYINVILSDSNSAYGTGVNGQRLNYDKVVCQDGDVIEIGDSYVLVLSLFNAIGKLSVAFNFDRMPGPKKQEPSVVSTPPSSPTSVAFPERHDESALNKPESQQEKQSEESTYDFYKPTKKQQQDHYNNKTIII